MDKVPFGFGQITKLEQLEGILAEAITVVEGGGVAVVDIRVEPGYEEPGLTAEPPVKL